MSSSSTMKQLRARVREPFWAVSRAVLRPTARLRVLPDFLVIGGQRCGTTSLHSVLTRHPNVASARLMKGVHYFDTAYDHDLSWYRTHFPTSAYGKLVERRTGSPLLVGEASPYYLFHPLALERIRRDVPGAKLIALLRDPVERTLSHYKHEVRRGNEPLGMSEALAAEDGRLRGERERIVAEAPRYNSHAHQTFSYAARSRYDEQVARLFELFPREQVLVVASERFFAEPAAVYAETLAFLGLPAFTPTEFPRENATPDRNVPPEVRSALAASFREPNERLFELLGERFPWQ